MQTPIAIRFRRSRSRLIVLVVSALCACGGPRDTHDTIVHHPIPRTARSLLLITMDTTRADHLQPYGDENIETPVLQQLAKDSIVFEHAYAVAPITLPAHTSILTGLYPPQHGVRNNGTQYVAPEITTLAERLRQHGMRTAAFVSAEVLVRRYGLDQGFEVYDDDLSTGRERHPRMVPDRPGEATVASALQWLDGVKADEPFFLWVHFYDPHAAYSPPPPYRDRYRDRLYDGEIAYMDAQIGKLLAHPRVANNPNLIVSALADHGESLGEHGEQTHALLAYDATLHVPWMLKLPQGAATGRYGPPVSQVDLVPTVLDLLGVDTTDRFAGQSLVPIFEAGETSSDRPLYEETYLPFYTYGWAKLRVMRRGDWKFIDAPTPELFDLYRDPRELSNVFSQNPGVAHDLQRDLQEFLKTIESPERETKLDIDSATAERLRSLGYMAAGSTAPQSDGPRPDPKDVVGIHVSLERVRFLLDDRLYKEAETELEALLKKDPTNVGAMTDQFETLIALGRLDEAEQVIQRAIALDPKDARLHVLYGRLHLQRQRPEDALKEAEACLAIDPKLPEASIEKAQALRQLRRDDECEAVLNAALKENGDDAHLNAVYAQMVEMRRQDWEAAEARLRTALARDPFLVLGWRELGQVQEQTGRVDAAITSYTEGLRREPDNADLHGHLGILLARRGAGEEAESHLREAIRLDTEFRPEVHVSLGAWLAEQGRLQEAQAEYAQVLKLDPKNAGARNNRAIALYRTGHAAEAEKELHAVAKEHPKDPDAHNNLAAIAADREQWKTAEREARRAVELNPNLAEGWSNLGIALDGERRYKDAEAAFQQALKVDPTYWEALNNLAATLSKERRWQEAAADFEKVLAQVPEQPEVHFELGGLYGGPLHDPERARTHYNAFLRHAPGDPRGAAVRKQLARLAPAPNPTR